MDLGLASLDFIINNHKKILKPIAGGTRAHQIDELTKNYPEHRELFIEFFSIDSVFEQMQKLEKGSWKDFKTLIMTFKDFCNARTIELDTEKILTDLKRNMEHLQADTKFEEIELNYLQKGNEDHKKIEKKLDVMHEDIKKKSDSTARTSIEISEVIPPYLEELKQKLEPELTAKFDMLFSSDEKEMPVSELLNWAKSKRKIILQGAAGGGKTTMVADLIRKLIGEGTVPVLIDLKDWDKELSIKLESIPSSEIEKQMDVLLEISKGSINIETLVSSEIEKWIIVDGLNEISAGEYGGSVTRKILHVVGEFARKIGKTSVVVTDRSLSRGFTSSWSTASINPLKDYEVQKQINEKFGDGKFETLSKKDRSLLSIPWFLKYALNRDSPSLGSEANALNIFFKETLGFDDGDLNILSEAAFKAYEEYGSPSFNLEKFEQWSGKKICEKLVSDKIINKKDDSANFEHQLESDYLVSRYLASNENCWTLSGLEIASFQSNSDETVVMALEQITDTEKIDKFLATVYDWNWPVAIRCTTKATQMGASGPSKEMEVMMVALAAQKIFDPMYRTSIYAKNFLKKFGSDKAKDFSSSKDISEVFTKANSIDSSDERFLNWRELFVKTKQTEINEKDVMRINEEDSLIGWTAANRLKEFELSDELLHELRTIYKTQWKNNSYENTVRWRIVHALGAFDSEKNAELLFEALDNDPFHWVKYGAARSLVEMAAIAKDQLRNSILESLRKRLSNLETNVLEEIGGSANRMNAPESWEKQMLPLLEECSKLREGEEYVNSWTKIIEEFKEEKWKTKG